MTSELPTTAARLRERMALGVIFIDSARITSPKPGSSTRINPRIASGVTSRGAIPVPPVVRTSPQPCSLKERIAFWIGSVSSGTIASATQAQAKPVGWGWGVGAGLVGAAIVGSAIAASNDGYYYDGYRRCGWVRQFDAYGNYIGRVRTCY